MVLATDPASIAVLITAISGLVLGAAGLWQSGHRDTSAARATATDVATKAADAAVGALNAALDRQQAEIESLTQHVGRLQVTVDRCEAEKVELRQLVDTLRRPQ